MKERMMNVLKWVLVIFGVLFLIQILVVIGVFLGIKSFSDFSIKPYKTTDKNLKDFKPIIDYVENYKKENGKYPAEISTVKVKPDFYFKYETTSDNNCYTITANPKNSNITKKYQHCSSETNNSTSNSESYVEFSN